MPTLINPYAHPPGTMLSAIQRLSLTSGLKLCLDAGDASSYSGSGQTWSDTSGNGYHFYRGSGSGTDGADPTFNGTAGRQSSSEYWSFDGGDYFTLGQSNPAWVNNIHKDGAKFTIAAWIYIVASDTQQPIIGTSINPSFMGWSFYSSSGENLTFTYENGSVGDNSIGSIPIPTSQWSFVSISWDETGGSGVLQVSGTIGTFSGRTYSSPPTSLDAPNTVKIGGVDGGSGLRFFGNGSRIAAVMAWEGVTPLTTTQLGSLYSATKSKFGH